MADWISPDAFTDYGEWVDEALAYDGNTATYGYTPQHSNAWGDFCKFTFSTPVTSCTKIRIWVGMADDADFGDLDVRALNEVEGEELVFTAKITEGEYVEKTILTTPTLASIKVRFGGLTVKYGEQRVYEIQAYGDSGGTSLGGSLF